MRVYWTDTAVAQLLAIFERIANDSEIYALQVAERLTSRTEQLAAFPHSGRAVPEYEGQNIREVIESPYRIIYKVDADQVNVLAVVHGQQMLPPTV